MEKYFCVFLEGFKNRKLATKAKLSKTEKGKTHLKLKTKTENETLDATPMQVMENTI